MAWLAVEENRVGSGLGWHARGAQVERTGWGKEMYSEGASLLFLMRVETCCPPPFV